MLKPALAAGRVASIAGPSARSQQQRPAGQEVKRLSYKDVTRNIRELKHQWETFTSGEKMTRMLVPGAALGAFLRVSASLAAAACLAGFALAAWWARQREPGLAATEILHAVQRSKTILGELRQLPERGHKSLDCVSEG